jgi:beta-phosphoglucomutase
MMIAKKFLPQAACFDLDGVILDTESQYTMFWHDMARKYAPEERNLEYKIKGQTLVNIFHQYFPDKALQAEITSQLDAFECQMNFEYIPGVTDFLLLLRQHAVPACLVTSSNHDKMNSVYRQHPEFKSYFSYILTSEDFRHSKPDPDGYLQAAAQCHANPANCVGFEDSFNGLQSVRASGMMVVGLATTNSVDAIRPLSDKVITDFRGLTLDNLFDNCNISE